jgi:hypothetical protein
MKRTLLLLLVTTALYTSCEDAPAVKPRSEGNHSFTPVKKYSGDLAVAWMKMQMTLTRTTPGFGPGPATRAFAYSGLSLYESIVEGIPGYRSVASFMIGKNITSHKGFPLIYWPASANAAMAASLRSFIPNATAIGKAKIDSLEAVFNTQFTNESSTKVLEHSVTYGRAVAASIFQWSQSDGFAEAMAKNSSYIPLTGAGLWKPTPPGFVAPVNVYMLETRTFVPNSLELTMPPAPISYSEVEGTQFYNMANEVYNISKTLTPYDILTVKTWGEFSGNYTNALRYVQMSIQLVDDANLTLPVAALAFAKHGMALEEAVACVFTAKYTYNVVRPITYIRDVIGDASWSTVNITPPHPEYPSAHSCVGRASLRVLESIFGTNYAFVDRTHESLYGARSYNSLKEASDEAGWSRVLGGIHYIPSIDAGRAQGEKVGDLINQLPFTHFSNSLY